ncbi:thermonuclease family protein [Pelomonas sp. SE-A7]|uniref:thermonuclease family protein n=1 Tax=Pelomonas sp. SE-A7 TaxID=3054953 RepID=UPI00338FCAD0
MLLSAFPVAKDTSSVRGKCAMLVSEARPWWLVVATLLAMLFQGCSTKVSQRQAVPSIGQAITCKATSAHHDGDTFTCSPDGSYGAPFVVRVASIDAPEAGQPYWRVSRTRLRELAAPGSSVECYKVDRFERRVCRLRTIDGRDAANLMLSEGLAWYLEDYADEDVVVDRERYRHLQAEAQRAKRGLWAEPAPMSPKACRQRRQAGLSCR